MKVEVNETLLKEFGRVYNAWNKEHGMEPVLDTRALADMAIAKAVMVMRDCIEADTERKKLHGGLLPRRRILQCL